MRMATAAFIAAHGIGYSIWFMSAWMPSVMTTDSKHLSFPPDAPATGVLGKALGVLAVAILVGFLASAWGVWQQTPWWPAAIIGSALASLPVSLALWNPVGIVSIPATTASVALIAATLMPWGERFLGRH